MNKYNDNYEFGEINGEKNPTLPTTMIYTHVLNNKVQGIKSPVDNL